MNDYDDEALSWAGDSDRLSTGASRPLTPGEPTSKGQAQPTPPPQPTPAVSSEGEPSVGEPSVAQAPASTTSSVVLVSFGILGGIYLLFTVAWLITALRNPTQFQDPLGNAMFVIGLWMAVAAPALWFGGVLVLVTGSHPWRRILCIALGAALFIPWPYLSWAR